MRIQTTNSVILIKIKKQYLLIISIPWGLKRVYKTENRKYSLTETLLFKLQPSPWLTALQLKFLKSNNNNRLVFQAFSNGADLRCKSVRSISPFHLNNLSWWLGKFRKMLTCMNTLCCLFLFVFDNYTTNVSGRSKGPYTLILIRHG
jgi:hypothetical protein